MAQSAYYQRVNVNAYYFATSSLPGIYNNLTDYCNAKAFLNKLSPPYSPATLPTHSLPELTSHPLRDKFLYFRSSRYIF
jgi:hypothetical protein